MRVSLLLLFFTYFILTPPVKAQKGWSLEDCIAYAMVHNIDIQKSHLNNQRNEENYRQTIRNLLPSFNAGAGYGASFGKSIDPITNDVIYHSFSSNSYSAGTSVSLFQGFRQLNSIAFSKSIVNAGKFDEQGLKATLSFQIMDAYYNVVFYKGLITIAEELLAASRWNLGFIQGMVKNGLKAESDILEIEASLASEELNRVRAQNQYKEALLHLKQLINYDKEEPFSIGDNISQMQEPITLDKSIDSLYQIALHEMPIIQRTREQLEASKINLNRTKSSYYPSLSAHAGLSTGFYQTRVDPEGHIIPFVDQLSNNASEYLSLSMSLPIFNKGMNLSQTKLAKIQHRESELNLIQEERRLYQKIQQDWQKLQAIKMEIELGEIQVKAMEANENIIRKKLEKGLVSQMEYNQAKNQLAEARSGLLSASLQYAVTRKTIDYYQGFPIPGMH